MYIARQKISLPLIVECPALTEVSNESADQVWNCPSRTLRIVQERPILLTDGPAPALHAAELAGNVYLHPGLEADDAD